MMKKNLHFTVSKIPSSEIKTWRKVFWREASFPSGFSRSRLLAALCSGCVGPTPSSWRLTREEPEPRRCPSSCRSLVPSGSCSQQAGWGSSSWVVPAHSATSGAHTPLPMIVRKWAATSELASGSTNLQRGLRIGVLICSSKASILRFNFCR